MKNALRNIALIGAMALLPLSVEAKVLVNVDGFDITDSMVNPILKMQTQNPNMTFDSLQEAQKTQVLDGLINMVLAANAAKKDGLDKSDEYKLANIELLKQAWIGKQLESISKTINVTQAEAQTFYNNNKQLFAGHNASVRHILVQKEDEAKNIINEIGKVPKTKTEDKVAELAKKFSADPGSKEQGGLIENLNLNDPSLAPEFAQETKKMTAGSYTKTPVKTRYGYHIIYLKKIDAPVTQSFDKVKTQIIEGLKQQKMEQILAEKIKKVRDNAKITYGK